MAPDGARGVGQEEPNLTVDLNQGPATDPVRTFDLLQLSALNVIRNTVLVCVMNNTGSVSPGRVAWVHKADQMVFVPRLITSRRWAPDHL